MAEIINDRRDPRDVRVGVRTAADASMSWRCVFAGFFISLLTFVALSMLGIAIGGLTFNIGDSPTALSIGTGVWLIASGLIATFVGSYLASRVSNFANRRVGATQGLVIASLFVAAFLYQIGTTAGWAGRLVGSTVSGASSAIASVTGNQQIQNLAQGAFQDLQVQGTDVSQAANVIITRLAQGNFDGAANYLSQVTGITQQEAQQRLQSVQAQVTQTLQNVAETTGNVISAAGWTLFFMIALAAGFGAWGGALGSRANDRHPLVDGERAEPRVSRVS